MLRRICMLRTPLLFLVILAIAWPASAHKRVHPAHEAPHVQIAMINSSIEDEGTTFSIREQLRVERFLAHVFPIRVMKRFAVHEEGKETIERGNARHITYSVISQGGLRFILAGFTSRWNNGVNVLAIYRIEDGWPNQVWRSRPWQGSYDGLRFSSAKIGSRNILLFQEGSDPNEYGLAGVFSFENEPKGLILRDLTPSLPWLRASTRFPFRPLLAQHIALKLDEEKELILTASDEEYNMNQTTLVRPFRSWKYNKARSRFERMKILKSVDGSMTEKQ